MCVPIVTTAVKVPVLQTKDSGTAELDPYRPFILKGFVSMIGSAEKVPVTILRDTGGVTVP